MALYWLTLNLISLFFLAYFSMIEMACLSFNRVRLQYYVSKGSKRAHWLNWMLHHPSRLFGTTLLGVNFMLMVGSECNREFYEALGFNPDLAPISQIVLVITLGELAPMFAARRHPEHVAMLGIPLLYAIALLFKPIVASIDFFSRLLTSLFGVKKREASHFLITREELQKMLEVKDHPSQSLEGFGLIVPNIFALRDKKAVGVIETLKPLHLLPVQATVNNVREAMRNSPLPFLPLYHKRPNTIVGIVYPKDLIQAQANEPIKKYSKTPWFISEESPLLDLLKQFRSNGQSVAIVLNSKGHAVGFLTLDACLEAIFGQISQRKPYAKYEPKFAKIIERRVKGDMSLEAFCKEFDVDYSDSKAATLAEMAVRVLGHSPDLGESIIIGHLLLTVTEISLTGVKVFSVTNIR
jgi:putative hemolysin